LRSGQGLPFPQLQGLFHSQILVAWLKFTNGFFSVPAASPSTIGV
jgi:hypothetical protein